MTVKLAYVAFQDLFKHRAVLVYVVSDGKIAAAAPVLSEGQVVTKFELTNDPPITEAAFTDHYESAIAVAAIL